MSKSKLADSVIRQIKEEKQAAANPPNKYRALINPLTVGVSTWYLGFWKTMGGLLLMNRLANEEDKYTNFYRPDPADKELEARIAESRKRSHALVEEVKEIKRQRCMEADAEAERIRKERKAMDEVVGQKIPLCPYCGKRHEGEC